MTKKIIFDLGNVLIPLRFWDLFDKLDSMGLGNLSIFDQAEYIEYEIGAISSGEFLNYLQSKLKQAPLDKAIDLFNYLLDDKLFPDAISTLEKLNQEGFEIYLLSNTNEIHISHLKNKILGDEFDAFVGQFKQLFLSHELGLRKPNREIYQKVLSEINAAPEEVIFIDDNEDNIIAAKELGIKALVHKPGEPIMDTLSEAI